MTTRRDFLAAAGTAAAIAATSTPAFAADGYPLRLPDMPLHDPFIVADKATDTYYLYTSNVPSMSGQDVTGTMVYRSRNLRDWANPVVVFQTNPGMWATDGAWAPEVHEHEGRYYLFTTLHNEDKKIPVPPPNEYGSPVQLDNYMRGTIIAVSDSLMGPFEPVQDRPVAPEDFMTLDGTLHLDRHGDPWMVYAHEWLQKINGTFEALPLKRDLSGAAGDPIHLFKASDPAWLGEQIPEPSTHQIFSYVSDGPQVYRGPAGDLVMLWSTYEKNKRQELGTIGGDYVQTYAVSTSGSLEGPWSHPEPLLKQDSGHGMIFTSLERVPRTLLVVHRPFDNARGKLYEVHFTGRGLRLGDQLTDLDGGN